MKTFSLYVIRSALFLMAVGIGGDGFGSCGTFALIKGRVSIHSVQNPTQAEAVVGNAVCSGDTVETGDDSRAKILINKGESQHKNELNLSPNTKLIVDNYEYSPNTNKKMVMLNILSGKVRATTTPLLYNDRAKDGQANTFEIRSKTSVCGVRGTDFVTSYDAVEEKMETITFSGRVVLSEIKIDGTAGRSVEVMPGKRSTSSPKESVSAPVAVPQKELERIDSQTKGVEVEKAGTAKPTGKVKLGASVSSDDNKDRAPASVATMPQPMVAASDLSGAAAFVGSGAGTVAPQVPIATVPSPTVASPKCDFCSQAIQSSKANVKINIKGP